LDQARGRAWIWHIEPVRAIKLKAVATPMLTNEKHGG